MECWKNDAKTILAVKYLIFKLNDKFLSRHIIGQYACHRLRSIPINAVSRLCIYFSLYKCFVTLL